MKNVGFTLFILISLTLLGCSTNFVETNELPIISEGVILRGCNWGKPNSTIENLNSFSVLIRHVWQDRGETTMSIFKVMPGQVYKIDRVGRQDGFYIYKPGGELIGWLSCNQYK